ncbi:visual pigment-like receptor peropsin [Myripristis murdjan]|uniref:Visual pigment-like receptor peropsin n=1 Tax=Myripristis murdjan TaxID=586833 RepID=A0A667ZDD1_9TELE|nr:visual pigment-like receptor peropsin [Myripristis murdjan]
MDITLKSHFIKIANIPWRNNNLSTPYTEPPLSDQGETIIGVYLLVLGWLSWFGNSLVIFVLYRQRASLQPTDFLTLNLAISDASISIFGYSRGILEIFNILQDDGYLITWIWTCQIDGFFTLLFGLVSINTLTVISVTRYIKGCHPQKANCISLNTIAISLICIWTGAFFWSVAPILGWGSYTDRGYGTCEVDWSKANYSTIYKSYIISILISCFLIPVMIMFFCYVSIINMVKNTLSADGYLTARQRKVERDVTRVSIVICTAFIMAWSPYAVVSMWSAWGFHVPSTTSIITRLFAKSASFYNPLIYFGMSSKFRKDVSVLLPCSREKREVVRLQHFKNIKPKAEATPPVAAATASLPVQKQEAKYTTGELKQPSADSDSGVNSLPHTPPPDTQEVFHIDVPSHVETSEYWCDRL